MTIRISTESGLEPAAAQLMAALGDRRHIALVGPMGAGKTTLTSALCRVAGVEDDVTSPTFSIINEYRKPSGEPVYHFDFYRIEHPEEAFDLGLDDYFGSGALCIMEWPENVERFLPEDTVTVRLEVGPDGERVATID